MSHRSQRSRLYTEKGYSYEEIRNLYVQQLAFIWLEDSTTESTRASVDKKIDSFVEGDLEHGAEIVSALWEIANKDGDIKAPSSIPSMVSCGARSLLLLQLMWGCICFRSR